MPRFALVVACALVVAPSLAADTPEQAVRAFFAAYAGDDAGRVGAFIGQGADALLKSDVVNDARVHCIAVRPIRIRTMQEAADGATVDTAVHIVRTPRFGGPSREAVESRTITLKKEGGAWRIVAMPLAEEALVDRIAKSATASEMRARVDEHPELLTPALVRRLTVRAFAVRAADSRPDGRLIDLAHDIALELGNRAGLAMTMAAQVNARRGGAGADLPPLIARAEEALRIAWEVDDPTVIGFAVNTLVAAYVALDGTSMEAERVLRRALERPERYVWHHRSDMYANLGNLFFARGDYAGAYRFLTEGLAVDLAENEESEAGFKEVRLGRLMEAQNDPELALEYYRRAAARNMPKRFLIMAHVGVSQNSRALGRRDEAQAAAAKALELARSTPFKGLVASAFVALASIQLDAGQHEGVEKTLQDAIAYAREASYAEAEIEALLTLGNFHYRGGRLADAQRLAGEALKVTDGDDFPRRERYAALMLTARIEHALGNSAKALAAYRDAIDAAEVARGAVAGSERQQRLFFEPFHAAYAGVAELLLADGSVEEALLYADRGKGRVLLDALGREHKRAEDALPAEERTKRGALVRMLVQANREVVSLRAAAGAAPAALAAAQAKQRRAQLALGAFDTDAAARNPAMRAVRGPVAIDAASLREVVADGELALLEFVVHDRATDLFIVHQRGGRPVIEHRRIAIDAAALTKRVDALAGDFSAGGLRYEKGARALYDLLLAPAAAVLEGKRVAGIVPDGVLWRLPFEALVRPDGRFVVERIACFYVPSIGVYRDILTRRRGAARQERTLAAFGNPSLGAARQNIEAVYRGVELAPLPDAEEEAKAVARLWGKESAVYTRGEAREETAKAEMQRSRIVHFAAHGVFDDANPMFSHIVLAQGRGSAEDGALQAWELMRLDLAADLVVLSACETARGTVGAGEGLIGMSWALFAGGCPSTVAAHWKVSSRRAAELMVVFHRSLSRAGSHPFAKAEALRAAQLALLRNPETRHPFYWAAFVLIGDAS